MLKTMPDQHLRTFCAESGFLVQHDLLVQSHAVATFAKKHKA